MKKSILTLSSIALLLLISSTISNKAIAQDDDDSYWSLGSFVNLPGQGTVFVCQGWGLSVCRVSGPVIGPKPKEDTIQQQ